MTPCDWCLTQQHPPKQQLFGNLIVPATHRVVFTQVGGISTKHLCEPHVQIAEKENLWLYTTELQKETP